MRNSTKLLKSLTILTICTLCGPCDKVFFDTDSSIFKLHAHIHEKILKEDDLRNRSTNVANLKGKTIELYLNFVEFKDNVIIFRDVYGENIRVITPIPDEFNLRYADYSGRGDKIISGYDFGKYGRIHPDSTLKEIIIKLAERSRQIPLSIILRFKIINVKRERHPNNKYFDYITVRGIAINLVI